jgi:hypothetical protein
MQQVTAKIAGTLAAALSCLDVMIPEEWPGAEGALEWNCKCALLRSNLRQHARKL